MSAIKTIVSGIALSASMVLAQEPKYDDMGPAAFMWPADRVWDAAVDNHAPCGSRAAPRDRTDFPMKNGVVSLVAQDDSWDIQLAISYSKDPMSNDDFDVLIDPEHFREVEPGHACVPVGDISGDVREGDLATLQVQYIADFDSPNNQTFYACADIVFVTERDFSIDVPCFNATGPEDGETAGPNYDPHTGLDMDDDDDEDDKSSSGNNKNSGNNNSDDDDDDDDADSDNATSGGSSNGKSGLGGGAIAGIVVGVVGGLALIGAAFLIYRRKQQRLQQARQANSSRGVQWSEQAAGKASLSSGSVRMQNM